MTRRWSYEQLEEALGGSVRAQARRLGVNDRQVYRWRSTGLSDAMADRCAIALGLHPSILWPGWDAPSTEQLELGLDDVA